VRRPPHKTFRPWLQTTARFGSLLALEQAYSVQAIQLKPAKPVKRTAAMMCNRKNLNVAITLSKNNVVRKILNSCPANGWRKLSAVASGHFTDIGDHQFNSFMEAYSKLRTQRLIDATCSAYSAAASGWKVWITSKLPGFYALLPRQKQAEQFHCRFQRPDLRFYEPEFFDFLF